MKRYLNHDRYEMNSTEHETLWHAVRRETTGSKGNVPTKRGAFMPALGVTVAAAALVLTVAWQLGTRHVALDGTTGQNLMASREIQALNLADESPIPGAMERAEAKSAPAVSQAKPAETAVAVRPAPTRTGLSGRIVDRDTGEPLANVSVFVRGTKLSAITDSLGVFHLPDLVPGTDIQLAFNMLSYDAVDTAVAVPADGMLAGDVALAPIIVATLYPFEVEGEEYMVDVNSATTQQRAENQTFRKYAIDSVEEGLAKHAGSASSSGGGNVAREVPPQSIATAPRLMDLSAPFGSVTGGTTPPNGAQVELMYFEGAGVNPFVATEDDALSTFAVDVDDASWTMARNYLSRGMLPPKEAIRVEEFVNAFDAGWPRHTDETFRIHTEGAASRFGKGYRLLRIGVVGKSVDDSERKPANLVFVIDISGSMNRESRLGTVKRALHVLLGQLREGDRVGIVVYGSHGQVRLPLTGIEQRDQIAAAIDGLVPDGSTNAAEGLQLAYAMARENYVPERINRLILCADGVANTGISTEAGGILDQVRKASDEGITLSTVGFGMGNYNDVLMEKLADMGDGNYSYVDSQDEADRVFRENLTGRLQTIAREVKVQVEFDPALVQRWRLLGYENRDVADEDFRNDAVDAGEVGAGHQVTALYELKLKREPGATPSTRNTYDDLDPTSGPALRVGTIRVRFEAPAHDTAHAGEVGEIEQAVLLSGLGGDYATASPAMKAQTLAAEFAEILRHSYWAKGNTCAALVPLADALAAEQPGVTQVQDLARMIRQAADLQSEKE